MLIISEIEINKNDAYILEELESIKLLSSLFGL